MSSNIKITTREDLELFEGRLLLEQKKQQAKTNINGGKTMINYKEFEIIRTLVANTSQQTDIAAYVYASKPYYVFKSLEEVQDLILSLERKGYIKNGSVTKAALEEIAPLKVKNAVILAAGGSDISAKSVYSMPKGLYVKNGETLIERQIRQLKEVGIDDITVVVGYKQEMYFS